ncbi:MAG: hypothetical protein H7172_03815, partial [Ferruginibacter sp.]|nr:hypothetical protein [Rhodoferax sp.]
WKFSGFGTLGAVVSSTDQAEFRSSLRQSRGADESGDLGVDSRLGLQANFKLNETFSAVAQVLTSRRDGSDKPVVEWLFGQAAVTPWLDLRAGRMVLPVFLFSDTRSVGYAQHWVRAPQEAYSAYPPSSFDGGMVQLHSSVGDVNMNLQVSAGQAAAKLFVSNREATLTYDKLYSVNLTAERGDWTARIGRTQSPKVDIANLGPLPPSDDVFSGAGLQYDNGKLLVVSEYLTRRNSAKTLDSNGYYASAGYRFGSVMPYLTSSHTEAKGLRNAGTSGSTQAVGVRWDALKNVALKTQLERLKPTTQDVHATPAFSTTKPKFNVLSVTADFVF